MVRVEGYLPFLKVDFYDVFITTKPFYSLSVGWKTFTGRQGDEIWVGSIQGQRSDSAELVQFNSDDSLDLS